MNSQDAIVAMATVYVGKGIMGDTVPGRKILKQWQGA